MHLCVGAVSVRVIEEAAKLQVHQIIASRRQVDIGGGYTGLDQAALVDLVRRLSDGQTDVVRDHGGPNQGPQEDDGIASFDADVVAEFDGLHIDVCKLPRDEQLNQLVYLIKRYAESPVFIQVGGERDEQVWLGTLLYAALNHVVPRYAVVDVGGHIHADRQYGGPHRAVDEIAAVTNHYHTLDVNTVAHNLDWAGWRYRYDCFLDAGNIAPEFGCVEVDALLTVLDPKKAIALLGHAYASNAWTRWFNDGEGTHFDRARCAVRYILADPRIADLVALDDEQETFVRSAIRDAIQRG